MTSSTPDIDDTVNAHTVNAHTENTPTENTPTARRTMMPTATSHTAGSGSAAPRRLTAVLACSALVAGTVGLAAAPAAAASAPVAPAAVSDPGGTQVVSPDGSIALSITTAEDGQLQYGVTHQDRQLVADSALGLQLTGGRVLGDSVTVTDTGQSVVHDETWQSVVGTDAEVRNHYTERTVTVQDEGLTFSVIVRAYDDGVAVRYFVPTQEGLDALEIVDEQTQFRLTGDPTAWWTARSFDTDENLWQQTSYSAMAASNAPVTFQWGEEDFLSVHEADLVDYSAMTVEPTGDGALRAALVPAIGREAAVVTGTDRATPWRALTISDRAGGLIESHLLENLNPPLDASVFGSEEEAREWVTDTTYMGIWWMLQKGQATWEEGPRHGATTARAKEYIDFASAHGIGGLLAEGWNKGWEGSWGDQDFATPTDDFDLQEVLAYGREKGVQFVAHNETGGNPWNYEKQIEEGLFETYREWGIHYLKTGYVGDSPNIPDRDAALAPDFDITNFTPKHHRYDQTMVNHYRTVLTEAAKNKINVNCHECVHGTGETRTFPNAISREAVRGGEWDAFSSGNSPEHTLILPFTRGLAGPMDYTPGIMNVTWNPDGSGRRVHSTAAKQLAEAVVYHSGVQMAADTPDNYAVNDGIEFYRGLPASWDRTEVVSARIGQEIVTARRSGDRWFVGAMTGPEAQTVTIPLGFLGEGTWVAESFSDGAANDYDTNPSALSVDSFTVTAADTIATPLGTSSGQAIRFRPATPADAELPAYAAPALVVTAIDAPAHAQAGDLVSVTVRARNEGATPARAAVTLSADGSEDQTLTIGAAARGDGSAKYQVRLGESGPITLRAGGVEAVIEIVPPASAPADLRIVRKTASVTELAWAPVEGAAGYELHRRTADGRYGTAPRAVLPADRTGFRDGRMSGASYRYMVRAVFADGTRSVPSNEVGGPGVVVATATDATGDDNGPGSYRYPEADAFSAGAFDVTGVKVRDSGAGWEFETTIAGEVTNPFHGNAISLQHIELYIADGAEGPTPARAGTNLAVDGGWDRVVVADGRFDAAGVYDRDNARVGEAALSTDAGARSITVSVPKESLPGFDPATTRIGLAMFSNAEGGEGINFIRPVYDWSAPGNPDWLSQWRPGGGLGVLSDAEPSKDTDTRDGNAFDVLVGEGQSQADLLDWTKNTPAVLPLVGLTAPQ